MKSNFSVSKIDDINLRKYNIKFADRLIHNDLS